MGLAALAAVPLEKAISSWLLAIRCCCVMGAGRKVQSAGRREAVRRLK